MVYWRFSSEAGRPKSRSEVERTTGKRDCREKKKSSHDLPQNNYSVTFINEAFTLVTHEFVQFLLSKTVS